MKILIFLLLLRSLDTMGSVAERDTPPPDYSPTASTPPIPRDRSLSPISELDTREEKLVKQTQYYFGDHVIERSKHEPESETKVKFSLDLRAAMFQHQPSPPPQPPRAPEGGEGLSSLDILPENTKPSLNRARMRRLFESQAKAATVKKSKSKQKK